MKVLGVVALVCLLLIPLGCGSDSATSASETSEGSSDRISPEVPPAPKNLVVEDLKVGSGIIAHRGDHLKVLYVGTFYDTGKEFVRRWGTDAKPLSLRLGVAGVNPAFQRGIEGMRVGGVRKLILPARLWYDEAPVEYVVRLAAVYPRMPKIGSYGHEGPFAAITAGKGGEKPQIDPANRPPPHNPLVRDLKQGSGPAARLGDLVGIYYAGAVYETGKVQYYGWQPFPPATFKLGFGGFGKDWEEGIKGMRAGGIREMVAPSRFFDGSGAVDYVIVLVSLAQAPS